MMEYFHPQLEVKCRRPVSTDTAQVVLTDSDLSMYLRESSPFFLQTVTNTTLIGFLFFRVQFLIFGSVSGLKKNLNSQFVDQFFFLGGGQFLVFKKKF